MDLRVSATKLFHSHSLCWHNATLQGSLVRVGEGEVVLFGEPGPITLSQKKRGVWPGSILRLILGSFPSSLLGNCDKSDLPFWSSPLPLSSVVERKRGGRVISAFLPTRLYLSLPTGGHCPQVFLLQDTFQRVHSSPCFLYGLWFIMSQSQ